jgi:hypothetical protein
MTIPVYCPGSIIDIGHKYGEQMPNRIVIDAVYQKKRSNGWLYWVFSEMHNNYTYMSESMIDHRVVGGCDVNEYPKEYRNRYKKGYRFCGDYPNFIAQDKAIKMRDQKEIVSVVLYPSLDRDGGKLRDYYGLWIKYNTTIYDDGTIYSYNKPISAPDRPIVIK